MRALLLLPMAAAVQVMETHQTAHAHVDYDGLKHTLKSIAEQREGTNLSPSDSDTIRRILETVNNTLLTALDVECTQAQEDLNDAFEALQKCDTDRVTWFNFLHDKSTTELDADRSAHVTCRGEEKQLCETRNAICNQQDVRVSDIDDFMDRKCPMPSFSNGDSDAVNNFMNCLSEMICERYEGYITGRKDCRQCCSLLTNKTSDCCHKQNKFEKEFCKIEGMKQTCCSQYRTCRKEKEERWYATLNKVNELTKVLQAQREALDCLQCYGRTILNNETDLSQCDAAPQCCELDRCPIVYCPEGADCDVCPPIPYINCTEPHHNKPCDREWCADEYGEWVTGELSRKPVAKCVPRICECDDCDVEDTETGVITSGAQGHSNLVQTCPGYTTLEPKTTPAPTAAPITGH